MGICKANGDLWKRPETAGNNRNPVEESRPRQLGARILPLDSGCFRVLPEASICLTNPRFEINDLKSMIWNSRLLIITNAYQPRFEISDY